MRNIPLVTSREYLTRVKKKSFILMTLLAPILISIFYGAIIWVSTNDNVGSSVKTIAVVDESGIFEGNIKDTDKIIFNFKKEFERKDLIESDLDGFLKIEQDYTVTKPLELKYESQSSLSVKEIETIHQVFKEEINKIKLKNMGITQSSIDSLESTVTVTELKIDSAGNAKSSSIAVNTALGMVLSLIIYFFIFFYGVQVMRGVIEEKTNRIVELIVSSVKPFELMLGKVLGIAAVGLTQLVIWIALSGTLTLIISAVFGINMAQSPQMDQAMSQSGGEVEMSMIQNLLAAAMDLPIAKILTMFIFFFIGGYLFYGAIFAAIGSAVDSETDTQQFMLPVTMPLIFSMVLSFSVVVNDPNGTLAVWLSIFPLTSPIVMMSRLPFDPPTWQLIVSVITLIIGILGVTWLAGKIYRTGILMYGKKASYKELFKWLFYKN